jgi:glutamate synthase (NADPH/NADH) small chain
MSKEFLRNGDGKLKGVVTVDVDHNLQEISGTEKTWEADLIFLSMGFLQPEHYINKTINMEVDERGNFAASKTNYRTSVPGIYAAADCRRGQDLVVRAINEGREAAREIDRDLMGSTQLP